MPLPILVAYGLRAGGAMLLKKVIESKLGKEIKEKLKKAIIKKFAKKSKKESRPLKRTTADKVFDTAASVGLATASINTAVEEERKPKKDRATWSKHETSVMKKNRKAKEEKARKIKEEREK